MASGLFLCLLPQAVITLRHIPVSPRYSDWRKLGSFGLLSLISYWNQQSLTQGRSYPLFPALGTLRTSLLNSCYLFPQTFHPSPSWNRLLNNWAHMNWELYFTTIITLMHTHHKFFPSCRMIGTDISTIRKHMQRSTHALANSFTLSKPATFTPHLAYQALRSFAPYLCRSKKVKVVEKSITIFILLSLKSR